MLIGSCLVSINISRYNDMQAVRMPLNEQEGKDRKNLNIASIQIACLNGMNDVSKLELHLQLLSSKKSCS